MWLNLLWAMLGGAAGSGCRFLLSKVITDNTTGTFPWGTFSVNMIGCLAIGILFGLIDRGVDIPTQMRAFLITGFCGGFTTGRFYYLIFQTGASRQNLIKPRLSAFVSCKINDLV